MTLAQGIVAHERRRKGAVGASPGADRALAAMLMRDNPLGQGHEQTPVCVLRRLGRLPIPA